MGLPRKQKLDLSRLTIPRCGIAEHFTPHWLVSIPFFDMAPDGDAVKPSPAPAEATQSKETQEQRDERFRKLYSNPPDFKQLAALDADFATV